MHLHPYNQKDQAKATPGVLFIACERPPAIGCAAMPPRVPRTFRDVNALAFDPDAIEDPRASTINHVPKKLRKTKGLEVVFDPSSHKEYLTGFRKRKQQRRAEAEK